MSAKKSPSRAPINRTKDIQTGLRMRQDDKDALIALSEHFGISMADMVTMLVRERARKEGLML